MGEWPGHSVLTVAQSIDLISAQAFCNNGSGTYENITRNNNESKSGECPAFGRPTARAPFSLISGRRLRRSGRSRVVLRIAMLFLKSRKRRTGCVAPFALHTPARHFGGWKVSCSDNLYKVGRALLLPRRRPRLPPAMHNWRISLHPKGGAAQVSARPAAPVAAVAL